MHTVFLQYLVREKSLKSGCMNLCRMEGLINYFLVKEIVHHF